MTSHRRIVVIGAGVGGLTTAALLAKAGLDVTLLEAHIYPGGCAGTFYHKGYRFDAGATLAGGFYPGGPMDVVARRTGIQAWPARQSEPAMVVHLPDGRQVTRWGPRLGSQLGSQPGDERWRAERRAAFGADAERFWQWQEQTADALWELALRLPPWPPQSIGDAARLAVRGAEWLAGDLRYLVRPSLAADLMRPVAAHLAAHLAGASESLRLFVDAQLLIAAQATSERANALYGAAALDLPRRGVAHFEGGIGAIATTLAGALQRHGGQILYRQEVSRIIFQNGRPAAVETKRGQRFPADAVIANLPPWNIARLLGDESPPKLRRLPSQPADGWGAFTVYAGVDGALIPHDFPLHHQVIVREPMGEGNTVFLSLSPAWDSGRAPSGKRALTMSTHTELTPWWHLHQHDPKLYESRKELYIWRMLEAAERALPGLSNAASQVMAGTPLTFQRFTRRTRGWVGGFPQTDLFRLWGPRLRPHLWMVGDSIFPGQSTAAVALGGLRVADDVLVTLGMQRRADQSQRTSQPQLSGGD